MGPPDAQANSASNFFVFFMAATAIWRMRPVLMLPEPSSWTLSQRSSTMRRRPSRRWSQGLQKVDGNTPTNYIYDTQGRLGVYDRYGSGVEALVADVRSLLDETE